MYPKLLLVSATLSISGNFVVAQTSQKARAANTKEIVHTTADVMPEPRVNINDFLAKNLSYPKDAQKRKIEGRVVIKFVVAEDGTVTNAVVERSVDPELDAVALETILKMPKWSPGRKNGKPVSVYYRIPVTFRLS